MTKLTVELLKRLNFKLTNFKGVYVFEHPTDIDNIIIETEINEDTESIYYVRVIYGSFSMNFIKVNTLNNLNKLMYFITGESNVFDLNHCPYNILSNFSKIQ